MKRTVRILPVFILIILMMSAQAFAATDSSYNYKVNVFSGNQGSFTDGSKQVTLNCKCGGRVRLDTAEMDVNCDNDKYFVKGIKEAGTDNSSKSLVNSLIAKADEDKDYVVAYGLKKDMVQYTVSYKDAEGRKLLDDDHYNGVVGDKPVVSYKYVKGYVPVAYNETKTLSKDADENVFIFYYNKAETAGQANGTASSNGGTGSNGNNGAGNSDTGNAAGQQGQQAVAQAGSIDDQTGNAAGTVNNDSDGTQAGQNGNQPQELVDLDDNEVPLADGSGAGESAPGFKAMQTLIIAVAAFAAAAILALIARKRKETPEE